MNKEILVTCKGANFLPIDKLEAFQGNLKTLNPKERQKIRSAIERFGFSFPVFVWENGGKYYIIDGHQRLIVTREMIGEGWKLRDNLIPVDYIEAKTKKEAKEKILLSISQYGQYTGETLAEFLQTEDLDIMDLITEINLPAFDFDGFVDGLRGDNPGLIPDDHIPEKVEPITKKGDLWILNKHRILCGDSTNPESVKLLMDGQKAGLMATDPPYGINYDSTATKPKDQRKRCPWDTIENDQLVGEKIQPFLEDVFSLAKKEALTQNAAWYLWHAHLTGAFFAAAAAAAADVLLHRHIIWVKPRFIIGMGVYHWQHEPCFMGWVRGKRPPYYGSRNQTTVWQVDYDGKKNPTDRKHPTQKPVELFSRPILNHLKTDEIAYEPFLGSGSQLIAAEKLDRICYGMEIDPHYCDVVVRRWEEFTGSKAVLI